VSAGPEAFDRGLTAGALEGPNAPLVEMREASFHFLEVEGDVSQCGGVEVAAPWNAGVRYARHATVPKGSGRSFLSGGELLGILARILADLERTVSHEGGIGRGADVYICLARLTLGASCIRKALGGVAASRDISISHWTVDPRGSKSLIIRDRKDASSVAALRVAMGTAKVNVAAALCEMAAIAATIVVLPLIAQTSSQVPRTDQQALAIAREITGEWRAALQRADVCIACGADDFAEHFPAGTAPATAAVLYMSLSHAETVRDAVSGLSWVPQGFLIYSGGAEIKDGMWMYLDVNAAGPGLAAEIRVSLFNSASECLACKRVAQADLFGVHSVSHEGRLYRLVVPELDHAIEADRTIPLRVALGSRRLGAITLKRDPAEPGSVTVFARVRGTSAPVFLDHVPAGDLAAALGPMVARRWHLREGAQSKGGMDLNPHEVALMQGTIADAIDGGWVRLPVEAAADEPTARSCGPSM